MSQSYTILPFINPPAGAYDALNAVASLNNNFSVSQSFNGIVNSGSESCASLSVSGASTFTGVCTFASIPKFNAGIEVSIAEVDTGTLSVTGSSSLNGGLTVFGAVSLPASSVVQSFVSSGYVDLVNAQTVAGVKTFSSPPVASGASLSANTVPALSIVNKSLGDAQISLSGISQTSVSSGYVDLVNAQSIAGAKTLSGLLSANAGLSVTGASTVQALTCSSLNCSSVVDTGTLSCTTLNCSSVVDAGTLSCTTLTCSGITDTGALACTTINASGAVTMTQGMVLTGSIVYNQTIAPIVPVTNDVAIALGGTTLGNYSVAPSANVNTVTITGASAGAIFDLLISPSAAITWRKAMSAGTVTIYNNLAGNQAMASGSRWLVRAKCVSATVVYLDFTNFT
jgi:hypothetical protein